MILKNLIKFIIIIGNILIVTNGFSQMPRDTIRIRKDLVEIASHTNYSNMQGKYIIDGKSVDENTFNIITKRLDSIEEVVDSNPGKYYIFTDKNNKVIEEGWWYDEFYSGYYKGYYPNGNIKEEGYYTEFCDSTFWPGEKIGTWIYYNKYGKVNKTVNHSPTLFRKNSELEPSLPPCTGSQKMLYKERACITLTPSKQKGITYHYSSANLQNKKIDANEIKNDSLLELKFLLEYASQFMDSVYSKKECINDGVFVVKILKHSTTDTLLEFSMSYIKSMAELKIVLAKNYITINGRKVLIVFSEDLKEDKLRMVFPVINHSEEDLSKYLPFQGAPKSYKGKYTLHGDKIEATIHPPYYIYIPAEEKIW